MLSPTATTWTDFGEISDIRNPNLIWVEGLYADPEDKEDALTITLELDRGLAAVGFGSFSYFCDPERGWYSVSYLNDDYTLRQARTDITKARIARWWIALANRTKSDILGGSINSGTRYGLTDAYTHAKTDSVRLRPGHRRRLRPGDGPCQYRYHHRGRHTVENVVRVTTYLTDASHAEANGVARSQALGGRVIPTTAIVVETLSPGWLVEIEAIAVA